MDPAPSAPSSPFVDLDRPPLRESALRRALVRPGGFWRAVEVVAETASTNTDLLERARRGAAEGTVLVAEHQTAGRGRLGRAFHTPPRAALTFSVVVRPEVPPGGFGWLPLLMGVAVVRATRRLAALDTTLKWPNDVLVGVEGAERKLAGILSEATVSEEGTAIVIGTGLNVAQSRAELAGLPAGAVPATSLAAERAACVDRDPLLRAILREFAERYEPWRGSGGDAEVSGLAAEYRAHCATLDRSVRVELPRHRIEGVASAVDGSGRLVVSTAGGQRVPVSAGDVVHVRRVEPGGRR